MNSMGLVQPKPGTSDMAWILGKPADATGAPPPLLVQGMPIIKPPYGQISAIDLDKGDILWQVAHGETPDNVRNSPALKGVAIPRTGRQGVIGVLTTKTLVIAGESGVFTLPSGQKGAMLRAYDKKTGKEIGAAPMPAGQTGSPMTYMLNGRQYIVVAVGGNIPAELVAFALPAS
jgi:quinoprotein glucose dehydrogenase